MCSGNFGTMPTGRGTISKTPAGAPPLIEQEERQWYIDQGFGDPSEASGPMFMGRSFTPAGKAPAPAYRGVSPEARYLYKQSRAPKSAPVPAPAPTAALAVPTATTRWAGKALTINPVSS
jgi:hypothetical protein